MINQTFKWAIMGAGRIAGKFCEAVGSLPHMEVASVSSKSIERASEFAKKFQIEKAFGDYEEMLRKIQPDAVYIATTPNTHYELTMLCLDYKVPVLCEKAMLPDKEKALTVFERSKKLNVFVMEAMWSRFLPHNKAAKQWLEEGKIGKVEVADISIGFAAEDDPQNRFYNPQLAGGAATDVGVYCFELITFFIEQQIKEIHTSMLRAATGVDKTEQISILFEDCIANLHASIAVPLSGEAVFYGTKGKIVVPKVHNGFEAWLYQNGREPEHFVNETPNGFVFEIQEAVECIRRGEIESHTAPHSMTIQCAALFDQILK